MPYYSELGIYTPSSSYTSPLLKGPYSGHSSIVASNILPPSSKQFRSNFRGFKPHLTTISESSIGAPLRRISSPKVLYHTSPKVRVSRPVKINTSDIDVSVNRYSKHVPPQKPEPEPPSVKKEQSPVIENEAKPSKEIRRDRATVRLQTIHKDTLEKEIGQIKSWRDNFEPDELAVEAKRRKKSPGEILKEKFLIRSKSKDNVLNLEPSTLSRKLSVKKSPSFKDICDVITSDQAVEDLNPGQPFEVRRRQSRQVSQEEVLKEIHRSSSTLSLEEVQILDALLEAEKEVGLFDAPPVDEEPTKAVKKKKLKKNLEQPPLEPAPKSKLRKDSSLKDMVKDISQVEIEMIPVKQKPVITGYIGNIEEKVTNNLKAVMGDLKIEESAKQEVKEKKFRFNVTVQEFPVKKKINFPKHELNNDNYSVLQIPRAQVPVVTSILKKRVNKSIGQNAGNGKVVKRKLEKSLSEVQVRDKQQDVAVKKSENDDNVHSNFTVTVNNNTASSKNSLHGSGKLKIIAIKKAEDAKQCDKETIDLFKSTKKELRADTFLAKARPDKKPIKKTDEISNKQISKPVDTTTKENDFEKEAENAKELQTNNNIEVQKDELGDKIVKEMIASSNVNLDNKSLENANKPETKKEEQEAKHYNGDKTVEPANKYDVKNEVVASSDINLKKEAVAPESLENANKAEKINTELRQHNEQKEDNFWADKTVKPAHDNEVIKEISAFSNLDIKKEAVAVTLESIANANKPQTKNTELKKTDEQKEDNFWGDKTVNGNEVLKEIIAPSNLILKKEAVAVTPETHESIANANNKPLTEKTELKKNDEQKDVNFWGDKTVKLANDNEVMKEISAPSNLDLKKEAVAVTPEANKSLVNANKPQTKNTDLKKNDEQKEDNFWNNKGEKTIKSSTDNEVLKEEEANFWTNQSDEKYEPPKLSKLKIEQKDPKTLLKEIQEHRQEPETPEELEKRMISKRSLIQKANKSDPDLRIFEPPTPPPPEPAKEPSPEPSFVPLQSNRLSQWMHPWKKPEQQNECPVEIFAKPKFIRARHIPRRWQQNKVEDSDSEDSTTSEEESSSEEESEEGEEAGVQTKIGTSTSSNDSGFDSGRAKEKDSVDSRESPGNTLTPASNPAFALDFNDLPEEVSQSSTYQSFQRSGRITPPATTIPRFRKYCVDDFTFLKVLGKGSFGKVLLAELTGTEYYYAIKCLKKDVVLEDDDVECTLIERKVLALGTKHPYLCHLLCTFQTESHLFFVMEYLNGGDLMFHIQAERRFSEARARFYGAEIVSGLKFLHNKGIVYRDLKLDNILLDFDGHVRIADFGMCKLQIFLDRMADTFCGTPDYMAPEIIKGQHYNQCVDWWSFGVLLYEMLLGQSPFSGSDEDELFWSICNEKPVIPRFLSAEAGSVLIQFLEKDANKRLGNRFSPHGDIQDHVFFKPIDWTALEARRLEPPFKPNLQHPLDTQYFDKTFTTERAKLTPIEGGILHSMDQTQFQGFSYTNPNATDK